MSKENIDALHEAESTRLLQIQEAKDAVKDSNLDLKWLETQSGAFATISTQKLVRILKAIRDLK